MTSLQKYFIHPITAFLFAASTWHICRIFPVFDFVYAEWAAGIAVLAGFLLLSRRYEMLLSVLFFSISLVVAYKVLPQQPQLSPQITFREKIERRLAVVATLALHDSALGLPVSEALNKYTSKYFADLPFLIAWHAPVEKGILLDVEITNPDDKSVHLWYLSDSLKLLERDDSL